MWSYETTRAVSLIATYSAAASSTFADTLGQTLTGTSTIAGVEASTAASSISTRHYGPWKISLNTTSESLRQSFTISYVLGTFTTVRSETKFSVGSSTEIYDELLGVYSIGASTSYSETDDSGGLGSTSFSFTDESTDSFAIPTTIGNTYNGTTTTSSYTTTQGVSTVSSVASTGVTATGAGTGTTTFTQNFTTSVLGTVTLTKITYVTSSDTAMLIHDTIVEAASTDWLWLITATGTKQVDSIGSSFTKTTWLSPYASTSISSLVTSVNATGFSTQTITVTSYGTTTISTAQSFNSSSTYTTGAPTTAGASIPLSASSTATVTFTSTSAATFTYHTSASLTKTVQGFVLTTVTRSSTITTTSASAGTFTTEQTQTSVAQPSSYIFAVSGTSTTNTPGFTASANFGNSSTWFLATVLTLTASAASFAPVMPQYSAPAIGGGFQGLPGIGYSHTYGQNLSGNSITIESWASVYPKLVVPVLNGLSAAVTIGGTAMTTQYQSSDGLIHTTQITGTSTLTGTFSVGVVSSISALTSLNADTKRTIGGYGWETATSLGTTITERTSTAVTNTGTSGVTSTGASTFTTTRTSSSSNTTTTRVTFTTTRTSSSVSSTSSVATTSQITTNTAGWGIHRTTYQDSNFGTSTGLRSWTDTDSTQSINRSEVFVYEDVPAAFSLTAFTPTQPLLSFSAFPST